MKSNLYMSRTSTYASIAAKFPLALILMFFCVDGFALTVRTAKIEVKNETDKVVSYLSVVHKYSNEHQSIFDYGGIPNGGSTTAFIKKTCYTEELSEISQDREECKLRYHTGFGTTGRDWWLVTWSYFNDDKVYYTKPNNFRKGFDVLDTYGTATLGIVGTVVTGVVGVACTAATAGVCAGPAAAATAGAVTAFGAAAVTAFAAGSLNSGSTDGFKQHILEDEDEGKITTITIKRDGTVTFKSPSGTSKTVSSSKKAPPLTDKQRKVIEAQVIESLAPRRAWNKVANAGIPGHNQQIIKNTYIEFCQRQCEDKSWCRSVDYKRDTSTCFLQPVSYWTKGAKLKNNYDGNPYDHYHLGTKPDASAKKKVYESTRGE